MPIRPRITDINRKNQFWMNRTSGDVSPRSDSSHSKTISDHGNVPLETAALKRVIDFAAATGYEYLQLDWGWYGTEVAWSPQQLEGFRPFVPERFKNTAWEINTKADPASVARGYVPYGWTERWKNSFRDVDLDAVALHAARVRPGCLRRSCARVRR